MDTIALVLAAVAGVLAQGISAAPPPAAANVAFAYVHHEIVVPVTINGTGPYHMLLDTDTTPSAIDTALARRLHLRALGASGNGSGEGSGKVVVYPVEASDLTVGGVHQSRLRALAVDLHAIAHAIGTPIDGVLGTSFLDGRVVQIDYACRTIRFLPDAMLAPFAARFLSTDAGNLTSDAYVGSIPVTATFDTGNGGSSYVTAQGIARMGLQSAARAGRQVTSLGYLGLTRETEGTIENVRIGRVRLGTLQAKFNQSSTEPLDLNVGNRVLDRFVVTFDYQRGLLTLAPHVPCRDQSARVGAASTASTLE